VKRLCWMTGGVGAWLIAAIATNAALPPGKSDQTLEQRFQTHIDYLADDRLEGRSVGSKGIELAAEYIAKQFADAGLQPAGDRGTYFQSFPMTLHRTLTDAGRLGFGGDGTKLNQHGDFVPLSFSSEDAFSGEVVFCGYGIVAAEKNHDDFVHQDLKGKTVLILSGEPPSWADSNGSATRHAMLRNKIYNVKDRGAAAVLLVNPAPPEGQRDELPEFDAENPDEFGIPAFHLTRAAADEQLKRAGVEPLATLQARLDGAGFASASLRGVQAGGQAGFRKESAPARNVLGMLRGKGAAADEVIIIGAHYDHLGIRKPMGRKFKDGKLVQEKVQPQIHNGADDNASGVSGLIEIARMFSAEPPPARSVLFVAFSAEETGLHGSKHYTAHPAVALDRTVAMLNMDMIGRLPPGSDRIQVFGIECGKEFSSILEPAASEVNLSIAAGVDEGGRSDHAPFVRSGIPSMHFFTGHHSDYHQPGDDSDKINTAGGAKVAMLVYRGARELASRAGGPTFQATQQKGAQDAGPTPTFRVVMGISPSYVDDGRPGMGVDAVSAEGPACLAGIKPGDRIVRISGKSIANIYDYMASTRNNNPGDQVEVVVLREGQEMTLKVTLSGAR